MCGGAQRQNVHYRDFVFGNPITENVEDGYVLYLDCMRPKRWLMTRQQYLEAKSCTWTMAR
jgi:hypothetical protein